ncbi:MAG: ORF6N domain-containing protein [Treponema sp.]|nr:ORF6N domain-containing protein [Treponema sp.]
MNKNLITPVLIESKIFVIRGKQVMIDRDLADLYGVETKAINQAVKRNIERFPEEFRFQLTKDEYDFLRSQIATLKEDEKVLRSQSVTLENDASGQRGKHAKYLPYVFTEQGVAMLSAVLHSETAIQVSIKIMNAFVQLRHYVSEHVLKTDDKAELAEIRRLLLLHIDHCDKKFSEQDKKINQIIHVLNNLLEEPKSENKIGFKTS